MLENRIGNFAENGQKMAKNDQKMAKKMTINGPKWQKMAKNGSKMAKNWRRLLV